MVRALAFHQCVPGSIPAPASYVELCSVPNISTSVLDIIKFLVVLGFVRLRKSQQYRLACELNMFQSDKRF